MNVVVKGDQPEMMGSGGSDPEAQSLDDALQLLARLIARKYIKTSQSREDADVRGGESSGESLSL